VMGVKKREGGWKLEGCMGAALMSRFRREGLRKDVHYHKLHGEQGWEQVGSYGSIREHVLVY
jgi:hypothetical protein